MVVLMVVAIYLNKKVLNFLIIVDLSIVFVPVVM